MQDSRPRNEEATGLRNPESPRPAPAGSIRDIIGLIRPHQWPKNLFLFIPPFFGEKFLDALPMLRVSAGFLAFCLVAGAVYVFNDLNDLESDRKHPAKSKRPLAAGRVGRRAAVIVMLCAGAAGLGLAAALGPEILLILAAYSIMNAAYTLKLKRVAIVDICVIALGFHLRILAGGSLGDIPISKWLVIMTFLLAVFLALAKRRDDVLLFMKDGERMRASIDGYNLEFINSAMTMMAAVTLVSYIMYAVSEEVALHMGESVHLSAFFVILGLLRYLQLTFVYGRSRSPTKVLMRDRFIQACLLGWAGFFTVLLYWGRP